MEKITQKKIASHFDLSEGHVSRIFSGKSKAPIEVADSLSKMASTDIRVWLFNTKKNVLKRRQSLKNIKSLTYFKPTCEPSPLHTRRHHENHISTNRLEPSIPINDLPGA